MFNKKILTDLKYDNPRINEIEDLLNQLLINIKNSNGQINAQIVYYFMSVFTMDKNEFVNGYEKNIEHLFDKWISYFNNKNVAFVSDNFKYWFQYVNGKINKRDKYIKLYIPIKSSEIEESVKNLFNFIESQKIICESKVASTMRNDNVIVRLKSNDQENALKIINFVNNNLKKGLNKTNPFVPNVSGVGYMIESGISYNTEISKVIFNYMSYLLNNNKNVNINEFLYFVKNSNLSDEVLNVFDLACIGKTVYKNDKESLLKSALRTTYAKYGYVQALNALILLVQNENYMGFTNENGFNRDKLIDQLKKDEALKIINPQNQTDINIKKLCGDYCDKTFIFNSVYELDDICQNTLKKYNSSHLVNALMDYYNFYNPGKISRFAPEDIQQKINYRMLLQKYSRELLVESMKTSLIYKNINVENLNINELVQCYVDELNRNLNQGFNL